jgi:hypothetical protein
MAAEPQFEHSSSFHSSNCKLETIIVSSALELTEMTVVSPKSRPPRELGCSRDSIEDCSFIRISQREKRQLGASVLQGNGQEITLVLATTGLYRLNADQRR